MEDKLGLFFGGRSVEHEISIISMFYVLKRIDRRRHDVLPIYLSKTGDFYTGDALLHVDNYADLQQLVFRCDKIRPIVGDSTMAGMFVDVETGRKTWKIDVAFPIFHGPYGEDGTIQGLFELMDLAYVGSGVLGSAVAIDKVTLKSVAAHLGIPVLPEVWFESWEWRRDPSTITDRIVEQLTWPMIVKPATVGSSLGINKVTGTEQLSNAIVQALHFSSRVLVEPCLVDFQEVNCAIIVSAEQVTISDFEIETPYQDILSYEDKYNDHHHYQFPARLTDEDSKRLLEYAERLYRFIKCSGTVRMDFLHNCPDGRFYLNEINTIAGALSYDLWDGSSRPFEGVIDEIVEDAKQRKRRDGALLTNNPFAVDIVRCVKPPEGPHGTLPLTSPNRCATLASNEG